MNLEKDIDCVFCGRQKAHLISKLDYWDLSRHDLVECVQCSHSQVDPFINPEALQLGCQAYYLFQQQGETEASNANNALRSFRRGVAFGVQLKIMGHSPQNILELGGGDGYFSRGIQYVFPKAKFTLVDIVPEVLELVKNHHNFKVVLSQPENILDHLDRGFDLVIARDLLEHLQNPTLVLKNISQVLKPEGVFHFICPNGFEDKWPFQVNFELTQTSAPLLINHVHYFNPLTLDRYLTRLGFRAARKYCYGLKWFFRGRGWSRSEKFVSAQQTTLKHADFVGLKDRPFKPQDVLNPWWLRFRPLALLYCYFKDFKWLRIPFSLKIGHEIWGTYVKKDGI